jgi:hypothetical protein
LGHEHDFTLYKQADLKLAPALEVKADLGFLGLDKLHSKTDLPCKASKHHPLSQAQKQANQQQASQRVPIEHTNRRCKVFRICGNTYRGKHREYESTWRLVVALVNLKAATNNLRFATP